MKCSVEGCHRRATRRQMCKTHYGRWKKHGDARPDLPIASQVKPPLGEWRKQAKCLGANPAFFYPEGNAAVERAKAVCHTCPVESECLEYAIEHGERHGVWGGESERERKRIAQRRRLAARQEGSA